MSFDVFVVFVVFKIVHSTGVSCACLIKDQYVLEGALKLFG